MTDVSSSRHSGLVRHDGGEVRPQADGAQFGDYQPVKSRSSTMPPRGVCTAKQRERRAPGERSEGEVREVGSAMKREH